MPTHTAIATISKGQIDAIEVPIEALLEGEVRIKVSYASMIAFDTYVVDVGYFVESYPLILGFNASGVIVEVGEGVHDLKIGDRVTAFTYQGSRSKALQEYTIQSYTCCAKIPDSLPLAEAATIPDNFVTAYHTLFNQLGLPRLGESASTVSLSTPILVYGAGATVGQYLIQLLHHTGYTKIIATSSSKHHSYLQSLGATHVFDYKSPTLVAEIAQAVGADGKVDLAVDCITAERTLQTLSKVVRSPGKVALMLPVKEGDKVRAEGEAPMYMELPAEKNPFPPGVTAIGVRTFLYQNDVFQKENLMPKILPELLNLGVIKANRVRLLKDGGLKDRVLEGLDLLRNNKVSGEKVVVQLAVSTEELYKSV